jgi:hypothetical protein
MELNENQRMAVMEYLLLVRNLIVSYGTPCEIEGMKYTDEQARARANS